MIVLQYYELNAFKFVLSFSKKEEQFYKEKCGAVKKVKVFSLMSQDVNLARKIAV